MMHHMPGLTSTVPGAQLSACHAVCCAYYSYCWQPLHSCRLPQTCIVWLGPLFTVRVGWCVKYVQCEWAALWPSAGVHGCVFLLRSGSSAGRAFLLWSALEGRVWPWFLGYFYFSLCLIICHNIVLMSSTVQYYTYSTQVQALYTILCSLVNAVTMAAGSCMSLRLMSLMGLMYVYEHRNVHKFDHMWWITNPPIFFFRACILQ